MITKYEYETRLKTFDEHLMDSEVIFLYLFPL